MIKIPAANLIAVGEIVAQKRVRVNHSWFVMDLPTNIIVTEEVD